MKFKTAAYSVVFAKGDRAKVRLVLAAIDDGRCNELPFRIAIIGGMCSGKTTLWRACTTYPKNINDENPALLVYTTNVFPVSIGYNDVLIRVFRDSNEVVSYRLYERDSLKNILFDISSTLGLTAMYTDPDRLEELIIKQNNPAAVMHLIATSPLW